MAQKKVAENQDPSQGYDEKGAAEAAAKRGVKRLDVEIEQSFAELRVRFSKIQGNMESHHVQDLQYEMNQLLDGLEKELRDSYGE